MEKTRLNKLINIFMGMIIIILIGFLGFLVYSSFKNDKGKDYIVTMKVKDMGNIVIKLYPDKAPNTVNNFLNLVNKGYYNDKVIYGKDIDTIHVGRGEDGSDIPTLKSLVDNSIEEGSDKDTAYTIQGEFSLNGFNNDLKHKKYMVSLSRANFSQIIEGFDKESYNSGSGLFNIIMGDDAESLDGKYAVFGEVIEGKEICDEIFKKETNVPENEENKFQLRRFYPYIEIENMTSNVSELKKVKYQDAFDLERYITEQIQKRLENN